MPLRRSEIFVALHVRAGKKYAAIPAGKISQNWKTVVAVLRNRKKAENARIKFSMRTGDIEMFYVFAAKPE